MTMPATIRGFRPAVLQVAVLLVVAATVAVPSASAETIRTPHYDVSSDLGDEATREIAQYAERLHAELSRRMAKANLHARGRNSRFNIKLFSHQEDFLRALGRPLTNAGGLYSSAQHALLIRADGRPMDRILSVLRHEGTHQFIHQHLGADVPLWLNEGMAVLFEESLFVGSRCILDGVRPTRLAILKQAAAKGRLHRLETLLTIDDAEWQRTLQDDPEQSNVLYAEAWSVVHFLAFAEDGRYQSALNAYMQLLAKGRDSQRAYEAVFGSNSRAFERKWRGYIADLEPNPRFLCARKLRLLAMLVENEFDRIDDDKPTFAQFAGHLRSSGRTVTLKDPLLGSFSTGDDAKLAELLRCPARAEDDEATYEFVYGNERGGGRTEGRPAIVCRAHGDYLLVLEFRRNPDGGSVEPVVSAWPSSGDERTR